MVRQNFRREFPDQSIISSTRGKHIPSFTVEDALEKDTTFEELVIQASKGIHVDLPLNFEPLQIGDQQVQTCKYRSKLLGKFGALHDCMQSFLRLPRIICHRLIKQNEGW